MQLLLIREFANELTKSTKPGKVVTSVVNPGFVATQIMRQQGPLFQMYQKLLQKAFARTPEEGSRTLVHGAEGGEETHGQYLDDCKVGRYVARAGYHKTILTHLSAPRRLFSVPRGIRRRSSSGGS